MQVLVVYEEQTVDLVLLRLCLKFLVGVIVVGLQALDTHIVHFLPTGKETCNMVVRILIY